MRNPKLWWPVDLGEPNLHDMKFTFEVNGTLSDTREEQFGIRKFEYFKPGSDNLRLFVNGVHVFMRGGNWGTDEMLKRIDYERLEAQVRYHRDAHFNMIRNWGGQSPSDELISLCDKYGLLFWDEFWQFNSIDPLDQDFYFTNVRDHVLHYRNHASLVIWCARNEATPPKYLDDEMRYLLLELDPKRHYQSNSGGGNGFNSGGPYDWVPPVRHSRYWEDTSVNKSETFKTEIGSFVVPTIESVQSMMPAKVKFDVKANGKVILLDFDAAATAGGIWKAVSVDVKDVISDADGVIKLEFEGGKRLENESRDPRINGFEILPQ